MLARKWKGAHQSILKTAYAYFPFVKINMFIGFDNEPLESPKSHTF